MTYENLSKQYSKKVRHLVCDLNRDASDYEVAEYATIVHVMDKMSSKNIIVTMPNAQNELAHNEYHCPTCHHRLNYKRHAKHCENCGQKVSWPYGGN